MHGVLHTAVDRGRVVQHVFEATFRPAAPDQLLHPGVNDIDDERARVVVGYRSPALLAHAVPIPPGARLDLEAACDCGVIVHEQVCSLRRGAPEPAILEFPIDRAMHVVDEVRVVPRDKSADGAAATATPAIERGE
jgi:hypothetical protein